MSSRHCSRHAVHGFMTAICVAILMSPLNAAAAPPGRIASDDSATKWQLAIPCTGCSGLRFLDSELPPDYRPLATSAIDLRPTRLFDSVSRLSLNALPYRDQAPLINRLRRFQALSFLTLLDTSDATLYVGVDRKGVPGLHLRQKNDRGAVWSLR